AGTALAPEERAGDASGGVHPLLDIHGEREEVEALPRVLAGGRGRQDHGVAELGQGRSSGLPGQPPGTECDLAGPGWPVVDNGGAVVRAECGLGHRYGFSLGSGTPEGSLRRSRSSIEALGTCARGPLPETDVSAGLPTGSPYRRTYSLCMRR